MRRRLLLSSLVVLAFALAIAMASARANSAVRQQANVAVSSAGQRPRWVMSAGVRVLKSGTGSGTVSSVPAGIDCGPDCASEYPWHTPVTLTATPAAGSAFTGWDACTGTGKCKVIATCGGAACTWPAVTANFTLVSHCVVPKVKGKTLAAAELSIRSRDCSVGWVKHVPSRTVKKGHVLSQKPTPETQLTLGANVNLVVSKGGS
jgi:hypothetical protein